MVILLEYILGEYVGGISPIVSMVSLQEFYVRQMMF